MVASRQLRRSPPVFEAAARLEPSQKIYVFRISGSRATELRLLAVRNAWTESCVPLEDAKGHETVRTELPWRLNLSHEPHRK
jgi:hypothetical protein